MRKIPALLITSFFCFSMILYGASLPEDKSVVIDGNILNSKAKKIGDDYYLSIKEVQGLLKWDAKTTEDVISISTGQKSDREKVSEIKGTVTYYFNSSLGDKPDAGANVYLVKSTPANVNGFYFSLADTNSYFLDAGEDRLFLHIFMKGCNRKYTFEKIAGTKVDGNGNYSIKNIKPGKYCLVIKSEHTIGIGRHDRNLFARDINFEEGITLDFSHGFGPTF
jgi:hypothetical protein